MKGKLKKQRRKIILSVGSILLAVWIVASVVFSAFVIYLEKEDLVATEEKRFKRLSSNIHPYVTTSHVRIAQDIDMVVEQWDKYLIDGEKERERNSGADGYHDENMHIVAYVAATEDDIYAYYEGEKSEVEPTVIFDTDKSAAVLFRCRQGEDQYDVNGIIDYDTLRASISDEQYKVISDYLNREKDADGYFYELMCTQFYYRESDGRIIPKTVEIVKASEDSKWYAFDEIVETFELTVAGVEDFTVHPIARDYRNIIEGQFVLGKNNSGTLIKDLYELFDFTKTSFADTEALSVFTYVYSNSSILMLNVVEENESDYFPNQGEYPEYDEQDVEEQPQVGVLKYAKKFNVLDTCLDTLLYGILILFVFLLIIAVILILMLCKIVKTQLREDEKRTEITNALAHDIKTPLFIISGYAQNLLEDVNSDKREHYATRIVQRTNEVNDIVHKMLDFTNFDVNNQSIDKEQVDIHDIVLSVVSDYNTINDNSKINIAKEGDCIINADKTLISRAIAYLVDNAVRYCEQDTQINIVISKDKFEISNVCKAITENDIKRLFEPYYKADKNRNSKGNGLGLFIVKSIADMHGFKTDVRYCEDVITMTIDFNT